MELTVEFEDFSVEVEVVDDEDDDDDEEEDAAVDDEEDVEVIDIDVEENIEKILE